MASDPVSLTSEQLKLVNALLLFASAVENLNDSVVRVVVKNGNLIGSICGIEFEGGQ